MSKTINLLISLLFFAGGIFAQRTANGDVSPDFFKDPKKLFCWNGPLSSSFKTNKSILDVPLMAYFDERKGAARIICKPIYGFEKWAKIVRQNLSKQDQRVKDIAFNRNEQKNFIIYAFFMEYKYLVEPTEKPTFPNGKDMEFPAPIHIYKKEGDKWKHLTKVNVKDWPAYSDLEMKYIGY